MRRALVLGGGGARGAFQVGMLQELVGNRRLDFQIIRGVSVGALNGAFLAQAPSERNSLRELRKRVNALRSLWTKEIKGNHSVYGEKAGFPGLALGADSLYTLEPLRKLIDKHVELQAMRASGRDFAVGTVSLVSGRYREWTPEDAQFKDKICASASIPVVFPYVDFKDSKDVLVDGGVRNITPLSSAFNAKPDEIYVLLTSRMTRTRGGLSPSNVMEHDYERWDDNWLGTKVSGLDVLKRTLGILTDEVYIDDIRGALKWNEVVKRVQALESAAKTPAPAASVKNAIKNIARAMKSVNRRYVPLHVIAPEDWYGDTNDSMNFSPTLIREAIQHGREIAADPNRWVWRS